MDFWLQFTLLVTVQATCNILTSFHSLMEDFQHQFYVAVKQRDSKAASYQVPQQFSTWWKESSWFLCWINGLTRLYIQMSKILIFIEDTLNWGIHKSHVNDVRESNHWPFPRLKFAGVEILPWSTMSMPPFVKSQIL